MSPCLSPGTASPQSVSELSPTCSTDKLLCRADLFPVSDNREQVTVTTKYLRQRRGCQLNGGFTVSRTVPLVMDLDQELVVRRLVEAQEGEAVAAIA